MFPAEPGLTRSGIHSISPLSNQVGCEAKFEAVGVTLGTPVGCTSVTIMRILLLRLNHGPRDRGPRSFDSKF